MRRGGGQRGQRLCGGHRQPHDPEGDAGGRGDDAGRAGGQLPAAPTARAAPRGSTIPYGVAVDSAGNVYVADYGEPHDPEGDAGGRGDDAGRAGGKPWQRGRHGQRRAVLTIRHGVAVDSAGNVYVADTDNHTIRKMTPAGVVTTLAGLAGSSGSDGRRRAAPRGSTIPAAWRWTARATSMWRMNTTTRSGGISRKRGTHAFSS